MLDFLIRIVFSTIIVCHFNQFSCVFLSVMYLFFQQETSKSVIQDTQDIPQTSKPENSGKDTSNVIPKQATPTKVTTDTPTKESAGTPTKRSSDTPKEQSPALTSANKPVTKVFTGKI